MHFNNDRFDGTSQSHLSYRSPSINNIGRHSIPEQKQEDIEGFALGSTNGNSKNPSDHNSNNQIYLIKNNQSAVKVEDNQVFEEGTDTFRKQSSNNIQIPQKPSTVNDKLKRIKQSSVQPPRTAGIAGNLLQNLNTTGQKRTNVRANLKFAGSQQHPQNPNNARNADKVQSQTVSSPKNYAYQQREMKHSAKAGTRLPKNMPKFVGDKKEDYSKTSRNGHYKKFQSVKNSDLQLESDKGVYAGTLPNLSTKKPSLDYDKVLNESRNMEQKFQKLDKLANQEKNKLLISLNDPMSEYRVEMGTNSVKNKEDSNKFQTRPITN